jgi:Trypsin-like peptidase domain
MTRLNWAEAEAIIRCTARVEISRDGSWRPSGTAFFVAPGTLLTCAHVIPSGAPARVSWWGPNGRVELDVETLCRIPHVEAVDPFPLPDVAVLRVRADAKLPEHPVVRLEPNAIGDELWAYGYTEAYRFGEVLGHSTRLQRTGWDQVDLNDPRSVVTVDEGALREGMSGSPVVDLVAGTVIGIVKRTAGNTGGWITPLEHVEPELNELFAVNARIKPDLDMVARDLWGELIELAAAPLATNVVALHWLAGKLGIEDRLAGDIQKQARSVARELFLADLEDITEKAPMLAQQLGPHAALHLLQAVAVCATYRGEPWLPRAAVLEFVAEVDFVAAGQSAAGRVLDLPSDEVDFREPFMTRGDSRLTWLTRLDLTSLASGELDERSGLPADVEQELRMAVVERSQSLRGARRLSAPELTANDRELWEAKRGELAADLARRRMIVFLPEDFILNDQIIEALAARYPFVFLAWSEAPLDNTSTAYRVLDIGAHEKLAMDAFRIYDVARRNLLAQGGEQP